MLGQPQFGPLGTGKRVSGMEWPMAQLPKPSARVRSPDPHRGLEVPPAVDSFMPAVFNLHNAATL